MVKYKCKICDKIFYQKSHWIYHTEKRKYPCLGAVNISDEFQNIPKNGISPLLEFQNIPKTEQLEFLEEKVMTKNIIEPKNIISDMEFKTNPINPDVEPNGQNGLNGLDVLDKMVEITPSLTCGFCNKSFSCIGNLNKHIKSNCKIKKQQDNEKELIFTQLLLKDEIIKAQSEKMTRQDETINELFKKFKLIEEQNYVLQKQLDNFEKTTKSAKSIKFVKSIRTNEPANTNNQTGMNNNTINSNNVSNSVSNNVSNDMSTNISNTNNIVMVNFGKEDLGMIDRQHFMKIVRNSQITGVRIPEEVLKIIHFNPQYPQLSNIYISDINREKCMVYDGGEWKLSSNDKIPEIIDKVVMYTYDKQEELKELYPNNKNLIDRLDVINKYNQFNDSDYLQDLIQEQIDDEVDNKAKIKRCEDFQKKTYNTIKTTLYNEGKNIIKCRKLNINKNNDKLI